MDLLHDELDSILRLEETFNIKELYEGFYAKHIMAADKDLETFYSSIPKQDKLDTNDKTLTDRTMMELSAGFDASHMVNLLWGKFQKMKADKEPTYLVLSKHTVVGRNRLFDVVPAEDAKIIFRWVPGEDFLRDMYILCTLFANRGSNWEQALNNMKYGWVKFIKKMAKGYGLKYQRKKDSVATLEKSDITLPSIAACFPNLLVTIFHKNQGKPLYSKADLGLEETISSAVLTPYIISCIPMAWMEKADVKATFFLAYILEDNVINSSAKELTSLSELHVYFVNAMISVVMSDKLREETMKYCNLNVTSFDGKLHHALDNIKRLRPDDPDLDTVLLRLQSSG